MEDNSIFVYVINEDGFIISSRIVDLNIRSIELDEIENTELPFLHKHKWNGTEWIEGESDEEKAEREALERLNDLQPSPEELDEAKTEIKILTLLSELEMI